MPVDWLPWPETRWLVFAIINVTSDFSAINKSYVRNNRLHKFRMILPIPHLILRQRSVIKDWCSRCYKCISSYVSDFINCSYRCKGHTISFSLCNINSLSLAFIFHLSKTRKCVYTWCCTHHTRPEKAAAWHMTSIHKFQSNWKRLNPNLAASRFCGRTSVSFMNIITFGYFMCKQGTMPLYINLPLP